MSILLSFVTVSEGGFVGIPVLQSLFLRDYRGGDPSDRVGAFVGVWASDVGDDVGVTLFLGGSENLRLGVVAFGCAILMTDGVLDVYPSWDVIPNHI